jgi:hypothetical protein
LAKLLSNDLRRYAVLGAEQRLLTLAEEAEQIYRAFPELRKRGGRSGRRSSSAAEVQESAPRGRTARRRRRRMSAEARKRISDAQKARWARQRGDTPAAGGGSRSRKKK